MNYIFLVLAIACEVIATTALKESNGFSRLIPSIIVVIGYAFSFYFLSLTLRSLPVGVVYAIWSGLGTAMIGVIGWKFFNQHLDAPAIVGICMILAGVLTINLFSGSVSHG